MGTSVRLDLPIPSLINRTGRCEASGTNGAAIHCGQQRARRSPFSAPLRRAAELSPVSPGYHPLDLYIYTYRLLIPSHPLRACRVVRWKCTPLRLVHAAG